MMKALINAPPPRKSKKEGLKSEAMTCEILVKMLDQTERKKRPKMEDLKDK